MNNQRILVAPCFLFWGRLLVEFQFLTFPYCHVYSHKPFLSDPKKKFSKLRFDDLSDNLHIWKYIIKIFSNSYARFGSLADSTSFRQEFHIRRKASIVGIRYSCKNYWKSSLLVNKINLHLIGLEWDVHTIDEVWHAFIPTAVLDNRFLFRNIRVLISFVFSVLWGDTPFERNINYSVKLPCFFIWTIYILVCGQLKNTLSWKLNKYIN